MSVSNTLNYDDVWKKIKSGEYEKNANETVAKLQPSLPGISIIFPMALFDDVQGQAMSIPTPDGSSREIWRKKPNATQWVKLR